MSVIEVEDLVKKYKDKTVVDNISFSVEEGKLFAFLGENGAGKSTTINILCTVLERNGGEAKICGHVLGKEDDAIRKDIGIVFQNSVLDSDLTVKENLFTRASYYGFSKKETEEKIKKLSSSFEIDEIMKQKYGTLSGGQRRRVDIIRALLHSPKVLFLDEPTTGLDPKSRKLVWDFINRLRKNEGMTIFLTTHYMEETRDAADVVILDKGKILASGSPANLKAAHASSRLIWYTEETAANTELVLGLSGKFHYETDHYVVHVKDNPTEFIYANRDKVTDYEFVKGTMDDVFLNLTGKELR
ncbi:MAG: ABC transporter ATP-binding protein [Lachnospiraceae bacterium]|nr:ABC transporter ATP-binding protein [Lachnospiraceae bacterium]